MSDKDEPEVMSIQEVIRVISESVNDVARLSYKGLEELNEGLKHVENALTRIYDRVTKLEDKIDGNNIKH